MLAVAPPAAAGIAVVPDEADVALLRDVHASLTRMFSPEIGPLLDPTEPVPPQQSCVDHVPTVFGLIIGTREMFTGGNTTSQMKGPANDVGLLTAALNARAPGRADVVALTGASATRTGVGNAMRAVLDNVRCGDRVFFHFGGQADSGQVLLGAFAADLREDGTAALNEAAQDAAAVAALDADQRRDLEGFWNAFYAFVLNPGEDGRLGVMDERDLTTFVTLIRNRGADIVVSIDAPFANYAAIASGQSAAGDSGLWSMDSSDIAIGGRVTRLLPNHGDFLAIYGSVGNEASIDMSFADPDGGSTVYGAFTFEFAKLLQDAGSVSARRLADAVVAIPPENRAQDGVYRVEGSDPDMLLFDSAPALVAAADAIRITSPEPMRGPTSIKTASIEVAGIVEWTTPAVAVLINDKAAALADDGRFSEEVTLKTGVNTVLVTALMRDGRILQKTLDIVFDGDVEALKGNGRRYAVIIANSNYGAASRLDRLVTPLADADAISEILTHRYGFVTEAALPDGSTVSLSLRDASLIDMQTVLYNVSQVAGENDTVLIYYAGHGIYEPMTTTAFWVPVDARAGQPFTYLSASAISEAIARVQARKVVLISDSCFSGALMRGGPADAEAIDSDARLDSLLTLAKRKTRLLISSGNDEPVTDVGGNGHSIFAQALLDGLSQMPYDQFSARELFMDYVIERVTANSKQEPQFRPLDNVGHEGGDVVFMRIAG